MGEAELRRAVVERPDDEEPRRAYAAWADADGERARADFVRTQLRLHHARHHRPRGEPRTIASIEAEERQLLDAHGARWASHVAGLVDSWGFRRGFVERVTLSAEAFLARGAALFEIEPVNHATLTGVADVDAAALWESPLLGRLAALDLGGQRLGDDLAIAIARSEQLSRLRWLGLSRCSIGMAGARALVASERLAGLRWLDFDGNAVNITPEPRGREWNSDMIFGAEVSEEGIALARELGWRRWQGLPVTDWNAWPPDLFDLGWVP